MKYIVAVSGGVDSVVLLHQLATAGDHELVVAHFDHGIRPDSAADARFVEALATGYHLPFVGRREDLGVGASEDLARTQRYAFLRQVAREHQAVLVTAHHGDDVVETIAINLSRGTGWRGLAVLNASDIVRPLLHMSKQEVRQYALDHRLEWVEDSTNATSTYLRNRLRGLAYRHLSKSDYGALQKLRDQQADLGGVIDSEVSRFVRADSTYDRYFVTHIDSASAGEVLQAIVRTAGGAGLTRPQCERALLAIKTARPGTRYDCGSGVMLRFRTRTFIVETS
jgi:tRNA(Ile)-lysidine synthetase-like protein